MLQQIKIYTYDQRSPEWYKVREGKITGTSVKTILGKWSDKKTQDAIRNLSMKLAIEAVHGMIESDYVSYDMQVGIDNEPSAFNRLSEHLALDFIELNKIGFIECSDHIGVSPDGLSNNGRGAEIKCPNVETYYKYVITEETNKDYYKQMQHQMFCGDLDAVYYFNYCAHKGKEYSTLKVVGRDEDMIALISERCDIVTELKLKNIEKLKSVSDFNIING